MVLSRAWYCLREDVDDDCVLMLPVGVCAGCSGGASNSLVCGVYSSAIVGVGHSWPGNERGVLSSLSRSQAPGRL